MSSLKLDERDLGAEIRWLHESRAQIAIKNLERRGLPARFVPNRQEALATLLEMIPLEASVGFGDSVTLEQIGIAEALHGRGTNRVVNPFVRDADGSLMSGLGVPREEKRKKIVAAQIEAMLTDVFLTGTNAVTLDGKLVNIDGHGNRVAPMLFGPDKVICVASANKIVADVDEALKRIHNLIAPVNNRRHAFRHQLPQLQELPCVMTGKCNDCNHKWRSCRYTVIVEGVSVVDRGRIGVVLVGEELGI